ncbi:hypothetical protein GOP47_0003643 [Adiantum capillus-veneris]|uniref:Uncharacterized protein n=1 Tax=Adiantum capillus-veneris TaxID=13818 RepID=A0A9D4V605_ADICA|nr:hypothetical protein GOP47_0003643 [Adiantum capillus-veneris]
MHNFSLGQSAVAKRNEELNMLLDWLGKMYIEMGVLLGPRDFGKTSLLRRLEELWLFNHGLAVESPMFYVDMRRQSWKSLKDASISLTNSICTWAKRWKTWVKPVSLHFTNFVVGVNVDGNRMAEAFLGGSNDKNNDLAHVLMHFSSIVVVMLG